VPGLNEVYKSGAFSRFGVSNFKAEDVQRLYDYSKEHNYVLPSVYQGNYSAVARLQETVLFPVLRKLNIAFYAYSPIAGGFLTKTKQDFLDGKGRFNASHSVGSMYRELYGKDSYLEALGKWEALATDAGLERAEVAYRWVAWNSPLKKEFGDAIIIGASNLSQLEKTLGWLKKGPLDEKTASAIDDVWKTIEHDAPLDNYHR
jgi:aflatoxin B1 aldehyde reductase